MKSNLVLIGLMGCGKTTVGKELSRVLGMPFFDIDQEIEKHHGRIQTIFEKGEDYFRNLETEMTLKVSSKEGIIISTGGGVVLRPQNVEALKAKGTIFYLNRTIEDILTTIDISNRPLLRNNPREALYDLHRKRNQLYLDSCDYVINVDSLDHVVSEIVSIWNSNKNK